VDRLQNKYLHLIFLFLLSVSARGQHLNAGDGVRLTFYNISDQISGDYFVHENKPVDLMNEPEFKEAYRNLRTKLINLYSGATRVLLVTSCEANSGKTTTGCF